jgi:hypothetical protein
MFGLSRTRKPTQLENELKNVIAVCVFDRALMIASIATADQQSGNHPGAAGGERAAVRQVCLLSVRS